jgi:hypothetical protein
MLAHGEVANQYMIDYGRSIQSSTRVFIKETGGGEIVPSTSGDASVRMAARKATLRPTRNT